MQSRLLQIHQKLPIDHFLRLLEEDGGKMVIHPNLILRHYSAHIFFTEGQSTSPRLSRVPLHCHLSHFKTSPLTYASFFTIILALLFPCHAFSAYLSFLPFLNPIFLTLWNLESPWRRIVSYEIAVLAINGVRNVVYGRVSRCVYLGSPWLALLVGLSPSSPSSVTARKAQHRDWALFD